MWLVIWCCRDLLFECVKQQNRGFRVITVLQFGKSHHALLPFLWGVFEFLSCFVVFVHSHKMTNAWWVLVSFGFFCCVCWDILRVVNILLYPALPPLFFSSSLPLFLFLCLSLFLSFSLSLLLLPTHLSDCSLHTKKHVDDTGLKQARLWKGNVQTIKCNYRIDSTRAGERVERARGWKSVRVQGCETQKLQQTDTKL